MTLEVVHRHVDLPKNVRRRKIRQRILLSIVVSLGAAALTLAIIHHRAVTLASLEKAEIIEPGKISTDQGGFWRSGSYVQSIHIEKEGEDKWLRVAYDSSGGWRGMIAYASVDLDLPEPTNIAEGGLGLSLGVRDESDPIQVTVSLMSRAEGDYWFYYNAAIAVPPEPREFQIASGSFVGPCRTAEDGSKPIPGLERDLSRIEKVRLLVETPYSQGTLSVGAIQNLAFVDTKKRAKVGELGSVSFTDGSNRVELPMIIESMRPHVLGKTGHYLIDTGAALTVRDTWGQDPAFLAACPTAGLETITGQIVSVPIAVSNVTLGPLVGYRIPTGFMLLNPAGATLPGSVNHRATVSTNLLRHTVATFDFKGRKMIFTRPRAFSAPKAGTSIPIDLDLDVPIIEIEVEGVKTQVLVDTGFDSTLRITRQLAQRLHLDQQVKIRQTTTGDGVVFQTFDLARADVKIGPFLLTGVPILLGSEEGHIATLGSEILSRFTVHMDFPRRQLILESNPGWNTEFVGSMTGFEAAFFLEIGYPVIYRVTLVFSGTPAEEVGLKEGDVILSVKDRPTQSLRQRGRI